MISFETDNDNNTNGQDVLATLMQRFSQRMSSDRSVDDMEEGEDMDNLQGELRQTHKRNREVDEEEVWMTVGRKGKLMARETNVDDNTRLAEDKIEVCITYTDKLPRQFNLAKMLKYENIQNVVRVKYVNSYKVLVQFSDEESADTLCKSKLFNENGYKCQKTLEVSQSYGVMKNIDLELTEKEILEGLSCDSAVIVGIKKLKRRNSLDGRWQDGEAVRVCFKGSSLPSYVKIFDTRVNITPYVYPVTQCSRCWRFGHTLKMCPSTRPICPKCSSNHINCESISYNCNNCGGQHMALSKTCPIYKREKKIRELMAEFNCSYKRALTIYVPPTPPQPPCLDEDFPELTRRTADAEDQCSVTPDICDTPKESETYAHVIKRTKHKKSLNKKNKKSNKTEMDDLEEIISEEHDNGNRAPPEPMMGERLRDKDQISWKILLTKLREKVTQSSLSWQEKIADCITIVFKWVKSYVVNYFSDLPCFTLFTQHGL